MCIFPSREEEPLVDTFVIEMLVVLVHSLKMAHRDEKSLGIVMSLSLLHLIISMRHTYLCIVPTNGLKICQVYCLALD